MIKALHVTGSIAPKEGGPAVSILNFCAGEAYGDVVPHLATVMNDASESALQAMGNRARACGATFSGFPVISVFQAKAKRWGISSRLALWLLSHTKEFDIVVVHGAWLFSSLVALACARLYSKPFVVVPHESMTQFDLNRRKSYLIVWAKRAMKTIYSRQASLVIFASELERKTTFAKSAVPVAVLHHPLYHSAAAEFSETQPYRRSLATIGYLGRFDPKKNIDILISCLRDLPPHIKLVLAGDGPNEIKSQLTSLALREGVMDRITWLGFVQGEKKEQFFSMIDLLAMPSAFESFGMAAAEAVVRRVPVIVSPTTGMAEVVLSHGGGLVCPATRNEFVCGILGLDRAPDKLEAMSRSTVNASAQLSFAAFGAKLGGIYRELVQSK